MVKTHPQTRRKNLRPIPRRQPKIAYKRIGAEDVSLAGRLYATPLVQESDHRLVSALTRMAMKSASLGRRLPSAVSSLVPMLSSMTFTALHRVLGLPPGPLTDAMLDEAVGAGAAETDDLDWKSELPPMKGLPQTDFPKDVAAMANSGGGVIVFGVRETQKAATERVDVGELDEAYERSLRSAAITAISPPVFGLNVHRLGTDLRAVVVEVPASIDGPHLIYKHDYFGAPIRNDSDTVWMKERQIEAMYRARFEERRHATEALDALYSEAAAGRNSSERAWLIAVAHPRIPRFRDRLTREEAKAVVAKAEGLALTYADRDGGVHPMENVERANLRPGLRR
ncbi:ATP-binding protein [Rhodococcus sp. 14-2483-1-2]|uniref:AlbA family DNA-binding domain-containing protein n=1 Tax=Rhodococcus sp. 14-2483-1-2 TaxID=2023147 RepID=UPI00207B4261|nr:ATP-binding protein [Rhodococcus sp. 14-2483-1-2]